MQMVKWVFTVATVLAALMGLSCGGSRFAVEGPAVEPAMLAELPAPTSEVTVPIMVPLSVLADLANNSVPTRFEGEEDVDLRLTDVTVKYWLERSPFQVSASDGGLRIGSHLNGRASALGFGVLNVGARVAVDVVPRIEETWRLQADNLALTLDVSNAELFGLISVRDLVSGELRPELERAGRLFEEELSSSVFLEESAQSLWEGLCKVLELDQGLFLHLRPEYVRASQPEVLDESLRFQVGVGAETKVSADSLATECAFPQRLVLEPPSEGRINVTLPAYLDYEMLTAALNDYGVGVSRGETLSVRVQSASLRPVREALLLEVDVAVRSAGWFGARGTGVLYVLATPALGGDGEFLSLEDVTLETQSRNLLVAAVGEAAELLLLSRLRGFRLDLTESYEAVRNEANAAIASLSTAELGVSAEISRVGLTRVDVGPEYLRLVANVVGEVDGVFVGRGE